MRLEETNKNQQLQRQKNRASEHPFAPKDSQIKINVLQNKNPASHEHCTESKDVTLFRQAWHTF